jgi:hypothetical protein
MAGWLIISLTKYSTGDTKPHKRTGLEGFSPILGQVFTGIALKQRLVVREGFRMETWPPRMKHSQSFPQLFLCSVFVTT